MIKGSEEFKEMIYNLMIGAFDLEHLSNFKKLHTVYI